MEIANSLALNYALITSLTLHERDGRLPRGTAMVFAGAIRNLAAGSGNLPTSPTEVKFVR